MFQSINVLLLEKEPVTISSVVSAITRMKECELNVSTSTERALLLISQTSPEIILISCTMFGSEIRSLLAKIRRQYQNTYMIVCMENKDLELVNELKNAGANDCVVQDQQFIPYLTYAVKKACIAISERSVFRSTDAAKKTGFGSSVSVPVICFSLDLKGHFINVNRMSNSLLGYEPNDLLGRTIFELCLGPKEKLQLVQSIQKSTPGTHFGLIVPMKSKSGMAEEFEIDCTRMEGDRIFGIAKKTSLTRSLEKAAV